MADGQEKSMTERLLKLPLTSRGTEMGDLLRQFWHPIARSVTILPGQARALRVLGEDLTLYRGESGTPHLVGGLCPHRRTLLHTGWVQGDTLRCMYHGWLFDAAGTCLERPAESVPPSQDLRIVSYPVHEYCGLLFGYLGDGPAPAFDLPRKEAFEQPGVLLFTREETWPCNWLQQVENSLDATHVSFVHHWGDVGPFGEAVAVTPPRLEYEETDAGIRQTAIRSAKSRRVSNWTFPNNNHIIHPGLVPEDPWIDIGIWMTPVDDTHTTRFVLYAVATTTREADQRISEYFERFGDYDPADFHDELITHHKVPTDTLMQLTSAQDYVAAVGQGAIADRLTEHLGNSDQGVVFLRRLYWRESEKLRAGQPIKAWRRLAKTPEMPMQSSD